MFNLLAAFTASLHPGEWVQDTSPEENLRTFKLYIEQFERWLDVCGVELNIKQRWGLLLATGKTDMEDLAKRAKIETRQIEEVQAVQGQPAVIGVAAGPGGQPPAIEAREAVPEVI